MKASSLLFGILLTAIGGTLRAEESKVPLSDFRHYFWGAREAYEDRRFSDAEHLFKQYRERGSPSDPLLTLAGCDPTWEVSVFSTALKESHECLARRSASRSWDGSEKAKAAVLSALGTLDLSALSPYVDCVPTDLVAQTTTCGAHTYRTAADLKRLLSAVQRSPAILTGAAWREFPIKPKDPQHVRWILYPISDQWKPCGMAGSPLISLREDPPGHYRIAGFAASCLGPDSDAP